MKRAIALTIITLGLGSAAAFAQSPTEYPQDPNATAGAAAAPSDPFPAAPATATPAAPPAIEQVPVAQAQPAAGEQPTMERFRQVLSPHGRWVTTPEYGTVWVPNAASDPGWRPYTNGRWVYTEAGWSFVSNDSWGWAPFHYGRWLYYGGLGWSWLPGYRWAPAWVSWRYGGDYVGWAPLGPDGIALSYYDSPSLWLSVRAPYFYRPLHRSYFLPTAYVRSHVWGRTVFAGLPRRGYYYSPSAAYISRVARVSVYRVPSRSVAPRWVRGGVYRPTAAHFRGHVIATPRGGYVGRPSGTVVRTTTTLRPAYRAPTSTYRQPWRPSSTVRTTTTYRPGNTYRPSPTYRPGSTYRPGNTYRPATSYRPAATVRPSTPRYRPTTVRSHAPSMNYRSGVPSYRPSQPMQSRAYRAPAGGGPRFNVARGGGGSYRPSSATRPSPSSSRRR